MGDIDEPHPSLVPPTPPSVAHPVNERGRRYLKTAIKVQEYMLVNLLLVNTIHIGLFIRYSAPSAWSVETLWYGSVLLLMVVGVILHAVILKPLHRADPSAWRRGLRLSPVIICGILLWYWMMTKFVWWGGFMGIGSIYRVIYIYILLVPLLPYFIFSLVSTACLLRSDVRALVNQSSVVGETTGR
ncbi:MAG: hypothetical protein BWY76_00701 [bacterium ADurb.Bin429]|nr:MAG: hypothetical protein BWY76_00701 [bacterium ADurb.Bin429]